MFDFSGQRSFDAVTFENVPTERDGLIFDSQKFRFAKSNRIAIGGHERNRLAVRNKIRNLRLNLSGKFVFDDGPFRRILRNDRKCAILTMNALCQKHKSEILIVIRERIAIRKRITVALDNDSPCSGVSIKFGSDFRAVRDNFYEVSKFIIGDIGFRVSSR